MDPNATLADIRQLISEAKNEAAAERLLDYLNQVPEPARSWRDTVSNLLAQYKRIKLQQQRNTISFDEARRAINQITDGLLASLAGIEQGIPAPAPKSKEVGGNTSSPPWLVIGVVAALVLATASFFMLRGVFQNNNSPADPSLGVVDQGESEEGECPPYGADSEFNIMLLPFQPLDGKSKKVELVVGSRLATEMVKYGLNGSVYTKKIDVFSNEYPLTSQQASSIGLPCKAQLIIWGTTEEDRDGNDIVTTKFRFIESSHFSLTDLEISNEATVDTVSSLSSIASSAELTEEIEMTIQLILGLVAHETDNHQVAAATLDKVIEDRGGVAANPKWGLIQADSYIKTGQDERAIEVYREMLKTDSTNVQARLQKGLLEYRGGKTEAASQDLTMVLEQEPENTKALTARAAVSVKRNDLNLARQDLDQLEKSKDRSVAAQEIRKNYNDRHLAEQKKVETADQQIQVNPNDTSAWRVKAEAAQNIGDFSTAKKAASNLLQLDPNNLAAIKTLQSVMAKVPDSIDVRRQLEIAIPKLSPDQLKRVRPLIPPRN
ncbi:hypothetical protein [Lewinella cohaerens]|uniref:hypothetical protein n=1 Tax=Lewinella cohaerens TaxID=70995 RepID=UPI000379E385|nr:hypothetical protein [Lewinella cohaerens]